MDMTTIKAILEKKGLKISSEGRLPNKTGTQLKLATGQLVNVYDNGNYHVQGKNPEVVKFFLNTEEGLSKIDNNKVFVVYGHDIKARESLELLLRRWNLTPVILDQLTSEGKTIIEKLENCSECVGFAVVLATPDDKGYSRGCPEKIACRARQNVVLELGMMLNLLGRNRVAVLIKDSDIMERPSDIEGLVYLPFKEDVKEVQIRLAKEMNTQGYSISLDCLV